MADIEYSSVPERAWFNDRALVKQPPDMIALNTQILRRIDIEELAARNQYSVFHKIILGLSTFDLEQQLQHSTAAIDDFDSEGKSPLWWAAARGDSNAVRLLLSYEASVRSSHVGGMTALHLAATPEVINLLLDHDPTVIDSRD